MQEGVLPHFSTRPRNLDYVGSNPEPKYYGADYMSGDERTHFLKWHGTKKAKFSVIRTRGLLHRRKSIYWGRHAARFEMFLELVEMDPFRRATAISSICNKVFRTVLLKEETIIPRRGYRMGDRQSFEALQWLAYIGRTNDTLIHGDNREVRPPRATDVNVDGLCQETNSLSV